MKKGLKQVYAARGKNKCLSEDILLEASVRHQHFRAQIDDEVEKMFEENITV